jgi:hypothetical protein
VQIGVSGDLRAWEQLVFAQPRERVRGADLAGCRQPCGHARDVTRVGQVTGVDQRRLAGVGAGKPPLIVPRLAGVIRRR